MCYCLRGIDTQTELIRRVVLAAAGGQPVRGRSAHVVVTGTISPVLALTQQ